MEIDMRSVSAEELEKIDARFRAVIDQAVAEDAAGGSSGTGRATPPPP